MAAAVEPASLVDRLNGPCPFTALASVNAAFGERAPDTADMRLKPGNKATLDKLLVSAA